MTATITEIEVLLPATPTYAERSFVWTPTFAGEGLLTMTLRKRPGGKAEVAVYAVHEQQPPEPRVREFLLLKTTEPGRGEVYEVMIGPHGNCCTCRAGQVKQTPSCRHRDAFAAILGNV